MDIDSFLTLAEKYAEITELTAPIVNELISKTVIHKPKNRYSRKDVTVEVFFTYVGKIRILLHREFTASQDIV